MQTQNAQDLRTAHAALQAETGKPDADPDRIASLKSQVTSLETSAATEAATTQAAAAMYRTDMEAVTHYNTQLGLARVKFNDSEMNDTGRAEQKAQIADLQKQLAGAQRALKYSSDLVHGRVGAQTGGAPPGVAPPLPSGVPPGARYSPSMKVWQAPDGRLFDASGQPTAAPGSQAAPPASGFMNNGAGAP